MTKNCGNCGEEKDHSEFNKNSSKKDGLQVNCRACTTKHNREYYESNKEKMQSQIKSASKARMHKMRAYLAEVMFESGCVDCGNKDIRVLEFDHISGEKVRGVASLVTFGYAVEAVKKEIEKCEVRCRNCHIKKTYERMGGSWHDEFMQAAVAEMV